MFNNKVRFLEKKIILLDPMKTYQISLARVLALLKYTKLDPESIKKILQNSCANGIGTIFSNKVKRSLLMMR